MATVYLETSVISYLAAWPSRDLVVAAHQQISHEWWQTAGERYRLLVSDAVIEEISAGDPDAAQRRKEKVKGLEILGFNEDIERLVGIYEDRLNLPRTAKEDLIHIAFAASYEVDYLATWNCDHIANAEVMRRLQETNQSIGVFSPLLVTPEELKVVS
jgi:hypothetical protein